MRMCCYSSLQLEILDQSWALHLLFASQEDQKQKQTIPSQTQMKPEEKPKKQNQIQIKSKQKPKPNLKKSNTKRAQQNKLPIVLILSCLLLLAYCVAPEKIKQLEEFPSATSSWGILGPSWLQVEGSWSYLGSKMGALGAILVAMARNLRFPWLSGGPQAESIRVLEGMGRFWGPGGRTIGGGNLST